MDWPTVFEIAAMLALALAGWIAGIFRGLRRDIEKVGSESDGRMDGLETRLVRCESVDAGDALERLGSAETRIARLEAAQITHEDLGRVYRRLDTLVDTTSSVGASVAEVKGQLGATQGQLTTVCEHLMREGR